MQNVKTTILFLLSFFPLQIKAQKTMNLDFENAFINLKPTSWSILSAAKNVAYRLDSTTAYSGKKSLLIESIDPQKPASFSLSNFNLPYERLKGKQKMTLSAFVKGDDEAVAKTTVAIKINKTIGYVQSKTSDNPKEWTKITMETSLDSLTEKGLFFYFYFEGKGKVWLDNFSIQIDGENIVDTPPIDPSVWLNKNAISIAADAKSTDFSFLETAFKDIPYIGLGETTHGTHEFFTLRTEMMAYMLDKMNFEYIALENAMFATDKINDYVLTGAGDIKKLAYYHTFLIWYSQELLDMIEMVKRHNQTHEKKVKFVGFDSQQAHGAMQHLDRFADANKLSGLSASLKNLEGKLAKKNDSTLMLINAIASELELLKDKYPKEEMMLNEQCIAVFKQCAMYRENLGNSIRYIRDSVMAANFVWLSRTYANSKFILWAHSEHLKRGANREGMGYWLNKTLGDHYANISFCTANGTFTTWGAKTIGQPEIVNLTQPENNNLEYYFMQAQVDNFFLFKKNKKYPDIFDQSLSMRDLGVGGDPQNIKGNKFRSYGAWNAFDGFVFIKNTKATEHFLLKK